MRSLDRFTLIHMQQLTEQPTDKPKGEVIHPYQAPICPYLGLRSDSSVVKTYATEQHLCYNQKKRLSPSLEHQTNFCLTHHYQECPFHSPVEPVMSHQSIAPSKTERPPFLSFLIGIAFIVLIV